MSITQQLYADSARLAVINATLKPCNAPHCEPEINLIGEGTIVGWLKNTSTPMAIKLDDGPVFLCGGFSDIQRKSAMADSSIGFRVAFFYQGTDLEARPLNPVFKSLMIDEGGYQP